MAFIAISNKVIARDNFGRFISECDAAAQRTVERAVGHGANLSRSLAPIGHKIDPRSIPIKESISSVMVSSREGYWEASARHALAQEFGAVPHVIAGDPNLSFYWEAAGRMFVPAEVFYHEPGLVTIVNHPGNPAQPYLRPAYTEVMAEIMAIAAEEYPG